VQQELSFSEVSLSRRHPKRFGLIQHKRANTAYETELQVVESSPRFCLKFSRFV